MLLGQGSLPQLSSSTSYPKLDCTLHDNINYFIKHLPYARRFSKHAIYIDLFASCNATGWILLVSLFYREGNWEIEAKWMTQVHLANKWQSWNLNPCMVPVSDENLWECTKEVNLPCQSSCFDIWAHSGRPKQNFQPNYMFSLGSFIPQG